LNSNVSSDKSSTLLKQKLNEVTKCKISEKKDENQLSNSRDVMYEKNMKSHFKIIRYIMVCGKLVAI
jgi:hypothetical protein